MFTLIALYLIAHYNVVIPVACMIWVVTLGILLDLREQLKYAKTRIRLCNAIIADDVKRDRESKKEGKQ